jgi:hypothetical protein
MAISDYINTTDGFSIKVADTLTTVTTGYTLATPILIEVDIKPGVQPATVLNLYSLIVQFGDNTEIEITQVTDSVIRSTSHRYKWPGQYEVKLVVIPKDGSTTGIFSNNFTVTNYIIDQLNWNYSKWPDLSVHAADGAIFHGWQSCPPGGGFSQSTIGTSVSSAAIPLSFTYNISNPVLENISFSFYSDGSPSQPWEIVTPNNKYAYLRPRWRFTDLNGNVFTTLSALNYNPVYINSSGTVQEDPLSGTLVGYTGNIDFYYIDDSPSLQGLNIVKAPTLWVVYNTDKTYNPQDYNDTRVPSYANSMVTLSTPFYVKALSSDHLGITLNGGNINLPSVFWPSVDSSFFVTINSPILTATGFSNKVLLNYSTTTNVNVTSNPPAAVHVYTPSFTINKTDALNRSTGGYYKNILSTLPLSSALLSSGNITVVLSATTVNFLNIQEPAPSLGGGTTSNPYYYTLQERVNASDLPGTFVNIPLLSGKCTFNVTDFFKTYFARKINESFDYGATLQSYALQDFIANDTNLITFLSAAAGDNIHPTENFGTVAYEKVANFVANNNDPLTSGVNQLYSLASLIDTEFDNYNYVLPPVLQRQFDLYSTPHERLWGTREKYNTNFNALSGHVNLGAQLSAYPSNTTVIAGQKIIINDTFNPQYFELIEVPKITSYASITANNMQAYFPGSLSATPGAFPLTSYPLSSFFGWGLKTPFLTFYSALVYNDCYTNTPVNNLIDWSTQYNGLSTTLSESVSSLSAWYADTGILENIYSFYLTNGLNLNKSKYY